MLARISNAKSTAFRNINKANRDVLDKIKGLGVRLEEKSKGTFTENWVKYWKNVFIDYKEVAIDVNKDMRKKPTKTVCILATLGALTFCAKHNPNETSFRDAYVSNANQLLLVHNESQNPEANAHLKTIEKLYNNQTLRRLNLGIASIMWADNYSNKCHIYAANCPYLKLQYKTFKDRIVDIGFLDQWWIIRQKMHDYDVNY